MTLNLASRSASLPRPVIASPRRLEIAALSQRGASPAPAKPVNPDLPDSRQAPEWNSPSQAAPSARPGERGVGEKQYRRLVYLNPATACPVIASTRNALLRTCRDRRLRASSVFRSRSLVLELLHLRSQVALVRRGLLRALRRMGGVSIGDDAEGERCGGNQQSRGRKETQDPHRADATGRSGHEPDANARS